VRDGGPPVLKDVSMATNFGTPFAATGFVGYSFGCVITSDMPPFDSRGRFRGQAIRRRHSRDRLSKRRRHGNQFWD